MRCPRAICAALLVALVLPVGLAGPAAAATDPYIVAFDEEAVAEPQPLAPASLLAAAGDDEDDDDAPKIDRDRVRAKVADLEGRHRFKASNVYGALGGFSVRLSRGQLKALQRDTTVAAVMPDVQISLEDPMLVESNVAALRTTTSSSPRTPAGIRRVGATSSRLAAINGSDQRVNADVAVLDTGVEASHPDLNVAGGYNCTSSSRGAWGDGHGHGTHVAGTIAALDNGIGVVGVAPGARIWSVKVLNSQGTGYASWLVCGIDWVTSQRVGSPSRPLIEVANMSLRFSLPGSDDRDCGGPSGDSVHRAICRSVDSGVVYAVAAGNEAVNARIYRPAAYEEVITVSAIADYDGRPGGLARQSDYCGFYSADADDSFADFSNYGADVDLTAPGKCVLSTYPGKRYAWMSGTSMATPHVAGGAALYRATYPSARPQQVKMALHHVARLDWRTSTDRDSTAERVLWVGSFAPPPDFSLSVSSPPSGYLSTHRSISLTVSVTRTNGHNAPLSMSLGGVPEGVTLSGGPFRGSGGTVTISVAPGTQGGRYTARVRASDGEVVHARSIELNIDADPPTGYFSSPRTGTHTVQSGTSAQVAWQEADAGSGLASRSLQRQRGTPRPAGRCAEVTWTNDGAARTSKANLTESLAAGYCYRWQLTVRDAAGNVARVNSGTVLVDATAPAAPSVTVVDSSSRSTPAGVQLSATATRDSTSWWFRGGAAGTIDVRVTGVDAESGIAGMTVSPTTSLRGWGTLPTGASGNPATVTLPFERSATSATFAFRSRNGAGATGAAREVTFRRDAGAPAPVAWSGAAASGGTSSSTSVQLAWTGGADRASGLATRHLVQRQRATPVNGSCSAASFADDGSARLLGSGATESGLAAGTCYRWLVRTADRVGNLASPVTSAAVLVGR